MPSLLFKPQSKPTLNASEETLIDNNGANRGEYFTTLIRVCRESDEEKDETSLEWRVQGVELGGILIDD
jgi:hypothetical protein